MLRNFLKAAGLAVSLALMFSTVHADESSTLEAIRADLQSGSLRPLLTRQTVISVPGVTLEQWWADVHIHRFAVTGFNANSRRYAARLRLHFRSQSAPPESEYITFIRVAGRVGDDYTVDQFLDYSTGLDLVALADEKGWLASRSGKRFLEALSQTPDAAILAHLAEGRQPALALWLAQCSGQPCEPVAMAAQPTSQTATLWQLQQAFERGAKSTVDQQLTRLREALGDDPWLWHVAGIYARHHQHCDWVEKGLRRAWQNTPQNRELADSTLQCVLAMISVDQPQLAHDGTSFLDHMSDEIGDEALSSAIMRFYRAQHRPRPVALDPWVANPEGE